MISLINLSGPGAMEAFVPNMRGATKHILSYVSSNVSSSSQCATDLPLRALMLGSLPIRGSIGAESDG